MARFLCTADVHIGRVSSVPGEMSDADLGALAAWGRIVDLAISDKADAVLVAGDFYDSLSAQYESRGKVKQTLERLRSAGVPVVAVAGNHDHDALPGFARAFDGLISVLASDRWEEKTIKGVRVIGQSFKSESHPGSMLRGFTPPADGVPTIGLVHADVEGVGSYGPTPEQDFNIAGVWAWVVGHVHAPRTFLRGTVAYPGSPQALDWGECGQHGIRWLEVAGGRATFSDIVPLSTVRYEYREIELAEGRTIDEAVQNECAAFRSAELTGGVGLRVSLQATGDIQRPEQPTPIDGGWYEVIDFQKTRKVNLEEEAQQPDARGQAARLLLGLKGEGAPLWQQNAKTLVENTREQMATERRRLKLGGCPEESVQVLRVERAGEVEAAVRQALLRIVTADGGAK